MAVNSLRSRLGKLAPGLTAKQRFILLLRAHNAGEAEDPDVRRTMPRSQVRAFNRYAHLAYVANATLGPVLHVLSFHVEGMEYTCQRLAVLEAAASQLEEQYQYPQELERNTHKGMVTVPEFLRGLGKELRSDLRREFSKHWRALRALETVWAEIAEEFDGEPVIAESTRKLAAETKAKLEELANALASEVEGRKRRLPEPAAAFVEQLREVVKEAYKRMGWMEPEDDPPGRRTYGRQARPTAR